MEFWLKATIIGISKKEHRTDKIGEAFKESRGWVNIQELKIVKLKFKRSKSVR